MTQYAYYPTNNNYIPSSNYYTHENYTQIDNNNIYSYPDYDLNFYNQNHQITNNNPYITYNQPQNENNKVNRINQKVYNQQNMIYETPSNYPLPKKNHSAQPTFNNYQYSSPNYCFQETSNQTPNNQIYYIQQPKQESFVKNNDLINNNYIRIKSPIINQYSNRNQHQIKSKAKIQNMNQIQYKAKIQNQIQNKVQTQTQNQNPILNKTYTQIHNISPNKCQSQNPNQNNNQILNQTQKISQCKKIIIQPKDRRITRTNSSNVNYNEVKKVPQNIQKNNNNVTHVPIKIPNNIPKDNIKNNNFPQKPQTQPQSRPRPQPLKQKRELTEEDIKTILNNKIGLINLGNTCYINTCLQILIHCPLFINNFFQKYKNKSITPDKKISSGFLDIIKTIIQCIENKGSKLDISTFNNSIGSLHQSYASYRPNDSQEFCRVFLEDINNELNEVKEKPSYRELRSNEKETKSIRDKEYFNNFKERENSIITDIFYSQIVNTFICECNNKIYSFQKILDFPLLLPDNVPKISINDLLKNYFKIEEIDFSEPCISCKKIVKHKKEFKISRPPKILILSLQRIDETKNIKNQCLVEFPEKLDITEFIDEDCKFTFRNKYSLFAVCNHVGNMDFGHYYAYVKLNEKEWYEFNDSSVRLIGNIIPLVSAEAYSLFYVLV